MRATKRIACVQTSPISFVTKEIGDVCTQATKQRTPHSSSGPSCSNVGYSPIHRINHYHQWISTVFIQLAALGAY